MDDTSVAVNSAPTCELRVRAIEAALRIRAARCWLEENDPDDPVGALAVPAALRLIVEAEAWLKGDRDG